MNNQSRIHGGVHMARRHFGTIRKRPSGRWQVLYERDGRQRSGGTFVHKADALTALSTIEVSIKQNAWVDPKSGKTALRDYSADWLDSRRDLAVRTQELYLYLLRKHILPEFGTRSMGSINTYHLRRWYFDLSASVPSAAAKSYRLLSTLFRSAVIEGLVSRSPCVLVGAGRENSKERPIASLQEVFDLARYMPRRLQLFVELAVWCQLRRGELLGLQRSDFDLIGATVQIARSRTFTEDGHSLMKLPKTTAGLRTISVPSHLCESITSH